MTRDKQASDKKRIIVDLSFPQGKSVNDCVYKNCVFGWKVSHSLPTIQMAVDIIRREGFKVKLASLDIQRAYRNFSLCPLDWPLLMIKHKPNLHLDLSLPFGTRASSLYMQCIAQYILRHLTQKGVVALFYLDDLLLIHTDLVDPFQQFAMVHATFRSLSLPLSYGKLCDPAPSITWLGINQIGLSLSQHTNYQCSRNTSSA